MIRKLIGDIAGFSVKFYTQEGNWDWVYNNTPVFFLRDPTNFPLFIHTQKRNPQTNLKDATMVSASSAIRSAHGTNRVLPLLSFGII